MLCVFVLLTNIILYESVKSYVFFRIYLINLNVVLLEINTNKWDNVTMEKKKEKDTTVWKPKGGQQVLRPSEPEPRKRKPKKTDHRMERSAGYDAPSSGIGKLGLLIGAGAIIVALAKGVRNSDYYKD